MRHVNRIKEVDFQPGWDANLMLGREMKNVVFLGNTEISDERKHVAFILLLRPTYMGSGANLIFQVLPYYI